MVAKSLHGCCELRTLSSSIETTLIPHPVAPAIGVVEPHDVRFYVDADELRELFDELVLPPPVRRAWRDWLRRRPCGA
jgi:hypothetical protein